MPLSPSSPSSLHRRRIAHRPGRPGPALVPRSRTARAAAAAAAAATTAAGLLTSCTTTSVLALRTGDCLVNPQGDTITEVTRRDCSEPHDAEVIGTSTVTADELPDQASLDAQARQDCLAAFADYIGRSYEDSDLELRWWVPTQESWDQADDRSITCLALTPDGSDLTESVRDSQL